MPPHTHLDYPLGSASRQYAHMQAAMLPSADAGALRLYTPAGGAASEREVVLLWRYADLSMQALIAGGWVNVIRTAAAIGLATDLLARPDARTLAVIGSGRQARGQLAAVCAVRPIERVLVYSPTPAHREQLAAEMARELDVVVTAVEHPREAIEQADVICGATRRPAEIAIPSAWVRDGAHVNSIGSHREYDAELALRSLLVVSDTELLMRESPLRDPLADLLASGKLSEGGLSTQLRDVVSGANSGRTSPSDVTLFVSPGSTLWDAAVAARIYRRARERGVGTDVPLTS